MRIGQLLFWSYLIIRTCRIIHLLIYLRFKKMQFMRNSNNSYNFSNIYSQSVNKRTVIL